MRILVLGSSGFLGRLLVDELRRGGHAVEGWSRSAADRPAEGSRRVDLAGDAPLPIPAAAWDAAVLLAGPSVPARFSAAVEGTATLRIAERALGHLARHAEGARVLVVSSAHVLAPSAEPLAEEGRIAPAGDYGAAKAAVEERARQYAGELDIVVARLFGSLGPGLPRGLLVPDLLERLLRAEPLVELAGPDGLRDLTDGRDVARALRALLETRPPGEPTIHVGSGRAIRLSELADRLRHALGSTSRVEFAPGTSASWIADAARLRSATGWTPLHDLEESIAWTARETALASRGTP
ncbi:MAG: NAD(P)-dependent oxidoreductase [Planctomycetota bacterium]|nr:NAD(P)-dependent oxidoreductase [Planctomycetota bacterium]